jgi:hypothetical protein
MIILQRQQEDIMLYGFQLVNVDDHREAAEKSLNRARNDLAQAVTDRVSSRDLLDYLHSVAQLEVRLEILTLVETAINEYDARGEDVYTDLLEMFVLNGADDSWSGRGNDLRRVRFDAARSLIKDLKRPLLAG